MLSNEGNSWTVSVLRIGEPVSQEEQRAGEISPARTLKNHGCGWKFSPARTLKGGENSPPPVHSKLGDAARAVPVTLVFLIYRGLADVP